MKEFYLEIPSDPANMSLVEEFVNKISGEIGIDPDKSAGVLLAVTEATTNAIIHANKSNPEKMVKISAVYDEDEVTLRFKIRDQGRGFDPNKIPDPTRPENLLKDSGRGLFLMKIYADDLQYNMTEEGTETSLLLRL